MLVQQNADGTILDEFTGAESDDSDGSLDSMLEDFLEDLQERREENPHAMPASPSAVPDAPSVTPEHPSGEKLPDAAQTLPEQSGTQMPEYESTDGIASVTGFSHADADPDAPLAVPETLGGLPVRSVAKYGFYAAKYADRVQLPACIETIGDYAFNGSALRTFALVPETALTVGNFAFADCKALETVSFSDRS